jgi:hypothetical protein
VVFLGLHFEVKLHLLFEVAVELAAAEQDA